MAPLARTRLTEDLLGPLTERLDPNFITPLSTFLVSEQNEYSHEVFSVGGGRYARVFVGVNQGWFSDGVPSVEEVVANMDEIRDLGDYFIPGGAGDELRALAKILKS